MQGAGADDPLRLETLHRLGDLPTFDMNAVRAEPGGEPCVALDQQRRVTGGGDLEQCTDDSLGIGRGREAHQDAGDVARSQRCGQARRETVEVGRAQGGSRGGRGGRWKP